MTKYKKISDTSIRVLETLKFFSKSIASIHDIIHHFEKLHPDSRTYTNEVILKYINTLKVFGFRFSKQKDKYVLLNTPDQMDFSESELKTIYFLEKLAGTFPEEKIKTEINQFLQELEKRFSDNTKILSKTLNKPDFLKIDFNYQNYAAKIKEYEKYCLDNQRLKITYQHKNETSIMVEPREIKYIGKEVYFSVYNPISAQIQDINFNTILKIEQLPLKTNMGTMLASVTFQLKDRLAKAYKLHDSEKLLQVETDGSIVVLNQTEDRLLLLKRLMRYGENCEVISPKTLREEMRQMIKATLKNYV